ncbi:discoidin domain-containing protein, partial [Streptomyces anulatus]|uniref:discoidin domain-containing protein n=1 Tax=Streptomyces anulatus TaxID=1892 RepID=UPI00364FEF57
MSVALVRPSRPPKAASHRWRALALALVTTLVATLLAAVQAAPAQAAPVLLSQGGAVTASSQENGGTAAGHAVDGDGGTRWSSAFSDPQWIRVDLGSPAVLSRVELAWEAAHAKSYRIELSADGNTWTTAYSTTTSTGGNETLTISGEARYVRLTGTERATGYGYSLWEFKVFGSRDGR